MRLPSRLATLGVMWTRAGRRAHLGPAVGSLPWLTHVVAAAIALAWFVGQPVRERGLTDVDPLQFLWMSPGIHVFAWLLCVPLAYLEAITGSGGRRWTGRAAASVATVVLCWFGALPVHLRFFADQSPVSRAEVASAGANTSVLLLGYLAAVVVGRVMRSRGLGRG